jgi:hypothetical protein
MKEYLVIDTAYQSMLDFDYTEAKRCGVDGIILHAGYGSSISQKDACFDEAYQRAADAGLLIGAYWFDYFRDEDDARTEAEVFSEAISGKSFPLGLYFDYEEATIAYLKKEGYSMDDITGRIVAAIQKMIELGWEKVRFYTNPHCFYGADGADALDAGRLAPYGWWLAKFDATPENIGQKDGITVVGKQWGNNNMKPEGLAWIPNIDLSSFYLDDIEDTENIEDAEDAEPQEDASATWSREQAVNVTDALYRGLLRRGYGDGENEGLVVGLMHDMTRVQALDSVRASEEYQKKRLIRDCYLVMRGSEPSDDELNAWLSQDEDTIRNGILYSDEFNNNYGV